MRQFPYPLERNWCRKLEEEFSKSYMHQLADFLEEEQKQGRVIYPQKQQVFSAFFHTPLEKVRVIIMGQDPYHGENQAHGLSFSVPRGIEPPPSLQNIFRELQREEKIPLPTHGSLVSWAEQGVLLLNATLTVRAHQARSHYGKGWELFTDRVLQVIAKQRRRCIFLLWGKSAREKCRTLQERDISPEHLFLEAPHPSPLSAHVGFFGCGHFTRVNQTLSQWGEQPIDWSLPTP